MKLINTDYKEQKVNFSGKRTDKNLVNELTVESGALFKPKQRAIKEAIVRLASTGSSENINFLFSGNSRCKSEQYWIFIFESFTVNFFFC